MEFRPYTQDDYNDCIQIFKSNSDTFFTIDELEEFNKFLIVPELIETYYVLIHEGQIAACGGFAKFDQEITLTWGMVLRELHKQGLGKALTLYRLEKINEVFLGEPIRLETSQHTYGFYEGRGFEVVAVEKDGFEPGLDKYVLVLGAKQND